MLHIDCAASQIDIYTPFVGFGVVLQAQFATYLFDARFDLLHMVCAVVAFTYNHM